MQCFGCRVYFCLFFASLGWAQHHDMKPPAEKPVALYKGMGNWHHPIATKNAEAQKFFDQGLALLYGFNRYEALRSFRKACGTGSLRRDAVVGHGDGARARTSIWAPRATAIWIPRPPARRWRRA